MCCFYLKQTAQIYYLNKSALHHLQDQDYKLVQRCVKIEIVNT